MTHCSHSSVNFMVPFPRTCGKMKKEGSMRFGRAREVLLGAARGTGGHPSQTEAFLDDIWCVSSPERTATGFTAIQEELLTIGIRVHDGKTQLWNRASPSGGRSSDSGSSKVRPRGDCVAGRHLIAGGRARRDCVGYAFAGHNWQPSLRSMTSCLRRS